MKNQYTSVIKKTALKLKQKLIFFVSFIMPLSAFADDVNGDKITSVLKDLVDLLASTPAKILFVVAIIGVGYGWLHLGKIPKEQAIGAIIGIAIIFSAGWIASQMGLGY